MNKLASYLGIAALTFAAAQAGAASLTLTPVDDIGESVGTSGNDYPGAPDSLQLGQLILNTDDGEAEVAFYYIGNEAGYTNEFFAYGSDENLFFSTSGKADNVWGETLIGTILMSSGALDFKFCTSGGQSVEGSKCVRNADVDSILSQWFDGPVPGYRSIGYQQLEDGSWLAFWDDSGAKNDDNHDDMIVRIAVVSVPTPETLSLLGIGLLALGLVRRRQNQTA